MNEDGLDESDDMLRWYYGGSPPAGDGDEAALPVGSIGGLADIGRGHGAR